MGVWEGTHRSSPCCLQRFWINPIRSVAPGSSGRYFRQAHCQLFRHWRCYWPHLLKNLWRNTIHKCHYDTNRCVHTTEDLQSAVAAERIAMGREKQLNEQLHNSDVKCFMPKCVSPHCQTNLAPSSPPLHKMGTFKLTDVVQSPSPIFDSNIDATGKTRNARRHRSDRPYWTCHALTLSTTNTRPTTVSNGHTGRKRRDLKYYVWWAKAFVIHGTTTTTAFPINRLSMMIVSN